jgi:hypothetical protein
MNRFCCTGSPKYKILFQGGSMGNDEVYVCANHFDKHPFDKNIIKIEMITEYN